MSIVAWAAVLRVVRVVFSAFKEAQSQPVPDGIGDERGRRHVFAVALVANSLESLESRLGRDIVHDEQFRAGIDLLLTGIRLVSESIVRFR